MNHIPMRRKEREVTNIDYIEGILKLFDTCYMGINDDDGYPYVVPVNFGFERTETSFIFYIHCAKQGHKIDLLNKDNRVCLTMSAFSDFPDEPYEGHKHDYRSVIAKGYLKLVEGEDMFDLFMRAHEQLNKSNNRDFDREKYSKHIPPMYMGVIECKFENVRCKSEFPINSLEDIPLHIKEKL